MKIKVTVKTGEKSEKEKKVFYKPHDVADNKLLGACTESSVFVWPVCTFLSICLSLLKFWQMLFPSVILKVFYFFLPKKLNLFSRSFSFPSLLRMVTPPASPELGEMGGIVMARLRGRGPPGDSEDPDGMELRMEWIQELISAFQQTKILWIMLTYLLTIHQKHLYLLILGAQFCYVYLTSSFAWNRYSFPSPSLQTQGWRHINILPFLVDKDL